LGNLEDIDNMLHEYRVSVNENEIMPEFQKQRHYNFLNNVKKLLDYLYGNDRIDPEYIKSRILKSDKIVQRQWLVALCDNIISNKIAGIFPQKTRVSKSA
jgi:DNA-directed RNA polymerase subunit F